MPAPAVGLVVLAPEAAAALVAAAKGTLAVVGRALGVAGVVVLAEKIEEQTKGESKDRPEDEICILLSYDSFIEESQVIHCKTRYPKRHVGLHPITGAVG